MKSVIDFETRSPVDIKTCGAYAYAAHPDTEVMMLAVRICGEEARVWVAPAYRHFLDTELSDDELQDIINNCEEIAAHNAPFERAIWKFKMESIGFKPLPLEKIRCTMSQALMCNLPRKLEQAVKVWRKDAPQKDNEGHKLMMKMSKPRKFRKAELSAFPDPEKAKATQEYVYAVLSKGGIPTIKNYHQYIVYPCDEPMFKRYVEYCRQDVVAEEVLFTELPPIPERELKVWRLDQTINDRGVGIDRFHAVKIMDMVNKVEDILTEEASEITYGAVSTMKSSKSIIEWLQSRGVDTDSASKQAISDLLERTDLPSDVRRFLEIRQTIAMSSTAKYQTMLCTSCYDGRAHGTMIYHGASTGRFAGALIQPQNLTRPSINNMNIPEGSKPIKNYKISDIDIELASSGNLDIISEFWKDPKILAADCLRAMIHAKRGSDFICADYSGIEARAIAYLAGEEYVLQSFRDNLDPYKVAASIIYGIRYEDVDDDPQRKIGKVVVLACGFGGGYGAFLRFGADRMGIGEEEGKRIINAWREGRPMTVKLWSKLVEASVMAMKDKGTVYTYRNISFIYHKRFLLMRLPSGRYLYYFDPKLEDVEMAWSTPEKPAFKKLVTAMTLTPEKQFVRRPLNHLILSENVTQAFCRDLMVNAMFNLEEANYPVVFHVHDEIIAEVPKGFGSVEEFESIMCKLPQWAEGLPVKAEGWRGEFYRK